MSSKSTHPSRAPSRSANCGDVLLALGCTCCNGIKLLEGRFLGKSNADQPQLSSSRASQFFTRPGFGILGYRRRLSNLQLAPLQLPLLRDIVVEESTPDKFWSPQMPAKLFSPCCIPFRSDPSQGVHGDMPSGGVRRAGHNWKENRIPNQELAQAHAEARGDQLEQGQERKVDGTTFHSKCPAYQECSENENPQDNRFATPEKLV